MDKKDRTNEGKKNQEQKISIGGETKTKKE